MSGTVNISVTADTAEAVEALERLRVEAASTFDQLISSGNKGMAGLQKALRSATAQLQSYRADLEAFGADTGRTSMFSAAIPAIERQIALLETAIEMNKSYGQSVDDVTESLAAEAEAFDVVADAVARNTIAKQDAMAALMDWDRTVKSAAESAAVFESTLETMDVSMAELRLEAEALAAANERLGSGITQLSGGALQELINTNLGVTKSFSDARLAASALSAGFDELDAALEKIPVGALAAKAGLTDVQLAMAQATGQIGEYQGELVKLDPVLEDVATSFGHAGQSAHVNTKLMTEGIVEVHEAFTDRFTRMPGTLMVLAESFGSLGTAMMGWIATGAIAVYMLAELAHSFYETEEAARQANAAMVLFDPSVTTQGVQNLVQELEQVPGVTGKIAGESVADMLRMGDVTESAMSVMVSAVHGFSQATGLTVPESLQKMAAAYADPINKGQQFASDLKLSGKELADFDAALQSGDPTAIRVQMLRDLVSAANRVTAANDEATISTLRLDQANSMGGKFAMGKSGVLEGPLGPGANAQIQEATQQLKDLQKAEADAASNTGTAASTDSGANWITLQQAALDQLDAKVQASATNWKQEREEEDRTDIAFWQGVISRGNLSTEQMAQAKMQLFQATQNLDEATLSSTTGAANKATEAVDATYSAQIAAAHGNAAEIEAIEQQKLDSLKAKYGENSAQYQAALAQDINATRTAGNEEAAALKASLANQATLDRQAAAVYLDSLKEQVSAGTITRQEELQEYLSFIQQQDQAQLQSVDNTIVSLQRGTAAYDAALKERAALYAQFQKETDAVEAQIAAAAQKSANEQSNVYTQAFGSIAGTARSQIDGIILEQQTWAGAAEKVYGSILTAFANMAASMLARWSATMVAQIALTKTSQTAVQVAQAAGTTGWAQIGQALLRYVGLEQSSKAVVLASTAATTAAQTQGAATVSAAQTAAAATARTQQTLTAVGEVHSAAAVAAANSFAATAAIPIVGPGLAPAAAAAAMAQVDAFAGAAALDVGAWNIPQNMPANLHAGEMVVPANFASGLRGGGLGGPSVANSVTYAPTVNASGGMQPSEVQSMLNTQFQEMVMYFQNMFRNGNLALPGRM